MKHFQKKNVISTCLQVQVHIYRKRCLLEIDFVRKLPSDLILVYKQSVVC